MNTATAVTIKDYIVDLPAKDLQVVKSTPAVTYEVVLENNTDFIVCRSTLQKKRELVILVSQGLYYFKDNKGMVDSVTPGTLKNFLRDLKDHQLSMEQVYWIPKLTKDSAEVIDRVISDEIYADMCRHNALPATEELNWYKDFWQQNSKLFMQLYTMFPSMTEPGKYKPSLPLIFELDKKFGYNEAMYFAQQLVQSGIMRFSASLSYYNQSPLPRDCDGFMDVMESPDCNLQLRRLIDYVLFDLYGQGIASIDGRFWREYKDHLEMQRHFYGKVKEKYPPNFKTAHDIITLKYNQIRELVQSEKFTEQMKKIEPLAHQDGEYCVVVPTKPQEVADEGINLNHCVKSYINRVAEGECHILFLRKTISPERPLVTLQLCGDSICQAQGLSRRAITEEERQALERWGVKKGIRIAT